MLTDTTNTTQAVLAVPGIEPDPLIIKSLFARLTVQEKLKAIADLDSLLEREG